MLVNNPILRIVTQFLIPFIFTYALYIQLNGKVSPGGGFQAGAIFASAIISFSIIFGSEKLPRSFSLTNLMTISAIGVIIYGSVGIINMIMGGNFLDYYTLSSDKYYAQYIGILVIELGVGINVTAVLTLIYLAFEQQIKAKE